jgi:hypothetical protein
MRSIAAAALLAATFLSLTWTATAMEQPIEVPKGDYCASEANEWVLEKFGDDTKILLTQLDKSGCNYDNYSCFRYNIWTDLCDGYFVFQYGFYSMPQCKQPQYRERKRMLYSVGAIGSCTSLLPDFEYPNQ